jgi:hypothetical protein
VTVDEARRALAFHAWRDEDGGHAGVPSFLGTLRPYGGLPVDAFHQVMSILELLAPELGGENVRRELVGDIWHICHLGRAWGVEAEGMLRRNDLISSEDIKRLADWIDCISYTTMSLLDEQTVDVAFDVYRSMDDS